MVKKFGLIFSVILIAIAVTVVPGASPTVASPSGEDDFQLVKVADGVYAAIAKSGGLASGNAGFVIGEDGVLIFDTFLTPENPHSISNCEVCSRARERCGSRGD